MSNLQRISRDDCPDFFDYDPNKSFYNVYNDGGHYVATKVKPYNSRRQRAKNSTKEYTKRDMFFNSLYEQGIRDDLKNGDLLDFVKSSLSAFFPAADDIDEYIEKGNKRKIHNLHKRKKLFRRKAYLNPWNFFVTVTYMDAIHTEDTFRKKLRKCLSNLACRRGWKYMGVFERAPETNRLHFHGMFYIPSGEMIGKLSTQKSYDTVHGRIQETHSNSFFAENYGRNDFENLDIEELKRGNTINYLLKYISKTDERIVYSRGVPAVACLKFHNDDIVCEFEDFVIKYVLFDDVIDWERDIAKRKKKRHQMTFTDLMCNPPKREVC